MSLSYRLVRPLLFALDAERAHGVAAAGLRLASRLLPWPRALEIPELRQKIWDLEFPNPVGLAAGMDKGEVLAPAWFRMGFGFVEIGTVTPRPQPGNPRPRLFRLIPQGAIINRMGFNNDGAAVVRERLARLPPQPGPVGANVGKNKDTPNESAADDYVAAFRALAPDAGYVAINVSSPNTPGLRALQGAESIRTLVAAVAAARDEVARAGGRRVPLLVKVSPDESDESLDALTDAALRAGADGFIAANTTLDRTPVAAHPRAAEAGGLSGRPLREKANRACARLAARAGSGVPIVGVGGIFTAEDAYERIKAGASLVQIYTALVYQGPDLPARIAFGLRELLRRDGLTLKEAIGREAALVAGR